MKSIAPGAIGLCAIALTACATPRPDTGPDSVVKTLRWVRSLDERVQTVSWHLGTANAALCDEVSPVLGAEFWSAASFDAKARRFAIAAFGIGNQPSVAYVVPASPAAKAGLRAGQKIIAVGDTPLPAGQDGLALFAAEASKLGNQETVVMRLTVSDATGQRTITMESVPSCRISVGLIADAGVNALTDGRNIVVTTGLLQFTHSDAELAIVIGHEIAHNILRHTEAMQAESLADRFGAAIDIMVAAATGIPGTSARGLAAKRRSAAREAEADYVGTYLAARAGYDTRAIEQIWKRLGAEHPEALQRDLVHPDIDKRFAAMETTSREIEAKKAAKQPLVPNGLTASGS